MKLKALALALFVAGACTSFALADDGPGKGKTKKDAATAAATTGTTTGADPAEKDDQDDQGEKAGKPDKGPNGKAEAHGAKKVTMCHKAGHSGRWVKISVSTHAAKAHTRHGDVAPDASGNCPAPTAPATTDSTTTNSTAGTSP